MVSIAQFSLSMHFYPNSSAMLLFIIISLSFKKILIHKKRYGVRKCSQQSSSHNRSYSFIFPSYCMVMLSIGSLKQIPSKGGEAFGPNCKPLDKYYFWPMHGHWTRPPPSWQQPLNDIIIIRYFPPFALFDIYLFSQTVC